MSGHMSEKWSLTRSGAYNKIVILNAFAISPNDGSKEDIVGYKNGERCSQHPHVNPNDMLCVI